MTYYDTEGLGVCPIMIYDNDGSKRPENYGLVETWEKKYNSSNI